MTLENVTFLTGLELSDGALLLGAQDADSDINDDPHTLILHRSADGEWEELAHTPWVSADVSGNAGGDGLSLIAPWGKFVDLRLDGNTVLSVIEDVDEADPPTVFRFVRQIDGELYAGGTDRFIFKLDGDVWTEIGVPEMKEGPAPRSFENLAGFGPEDLYAFGWDGALWTNHGGDWHNVPSPTELILNGGDVTTEHVFIGGQLGTILQGRGDNWSLIEHDVTNHDIWSVRVFNDIPYFATSLGIYKLEDGELSVVVEPNPGMRSTMKLFVGPSGLWSVGARDLAVFDGEEWTTVAQT